MEAKLCTAVYGQAANATTHEVIEILLERQHCGVKFGILSNNGINFSLMLIYL
jgi:hypothetical protein